MGDQYIHNLAKSLTGQLHITSEDLFFLGGSKLKVTSSDEARHAIYWRRGKDIKEKLQSMRPETLGRIAVQGKGNELCQVYGFRPKDLDLYAGGKAILLELATLTIAAEMGNILIAAE